MSSAARAERRRQERAAAKGPALRLVYQRGDGDCQRACIATIVGVGLDDTPAECNGTHVDPGRVLLAWEDWYAERGLACFASSVYAPAFLERWIAIVPVFNELHAVVMERDRLLHNPDRTSPQQSIDRLCVHGSMIVGPAEWVDAQEFRMRQLAHAGSPEVWELDTPEGAFLRQMMQGEFT